MNILSQILRDFRDVLLNPSRFFKEVERKKFKDVVSYIIGMSTIVFFLTYFISFFITEQLSIMDIVIIFGIIILWISLSLFSILPISIITRLHLSDEMRAHFKEHPNEAFNWASERRPKFFKVIGYSITPIILFIIPGIIFSTFFYYLSWLWLVIGSIGVSEVFKISKIEAFLCLVISYFFVVVLVLEPIMQLI